MLLLNQDLTELESPCLSAEAPRRRGFASSKVATASRLPRSVAVISIVNIIMVYILGVLVAGSRSLLLGTR